MSGVLISAALLAQAAESVRLVPLARDAPIEVEMGAGDVTESTLRLRGGESAEIVVLQQGVDVVVEVLGPTGLLLDAVDSPNGSQGPEPVSLFAREAGDYRLRIRPIAANEPRGRITVRIAEFRNVAATRRLRDERRRVREEAATWLRRRSAPLPLTGIVEENQALAPFDALAESATVVGLGETTHGSRELNDLRLALIQRLVRRHNYRLVALEDSASRWRSIAGYVAGIAVAPGDAALEWGWIGRRSRRQLLDWVRQWNLAHPHDRVRIVGVDAQDNEGDRARLGEFLARAYGEAVSAQWTGHVAELAAADEQTAVFGDSGTSGELRQFMQDIVAQLTADAPLLRPRFGAEAFNAAHEAALSLAAFVDFNSGGGPLAHYRDWHMASAVMRAIDQAGGRPKTVFWGHNAHVSAAPTRWGPTGALLRQALGCGYRAVATSFGQGGFIAQVPGDPNARLAHTMLPRPANEETVETMLAAVSPGAHLSAWGCDADEGGLPSWFRTERPMRWVGGVHDPGSPATASFRPYRLATAFDGIVFIPSVTAEDLPEARPVVPPRRRGPEPSAR